MAFMRSTKGDVEGGNIPVCCQEFITKEKYGDLEIRGFTTKEIKHVVIPTEINGKKVTKIGRFAFDGCASLTSVVIPNSVTSISEYALWNCRRLTIYCEAESQPSVWPDSWKSSSCPVVWNCKNNDVANNGKIYLVDDGVRYSIYEGKATVEEQSIAITTSNIKEKISYKGNEYTVTTIVNEAFNDCTGLTSVTIPNSVTTIGVDAFRGCTKLTSITIPNSVTTIGNEAFRGCTGLTSVTIGDDVTIIGDGTFSDCHELTRVDISDIGAWCNISFGDIYANPLSCAKNLYLNGELVTDLVIPNSVTTIGEGAFENCTGLTSVTIPNSVTTIGNSAFCNCTGLTSVEIPSSVTTIGNYAFDGCKGITSVVIPNSVTTIGEDAFYNCTSLTSVEIPNSVTSIGGYAFCGCTGLTSITIPNSVTLIGWSAFYDCTGLTIYCEAESQPSGWNSDWNYSYCPIVWDCKNNDVASNGKIYLVDDGVRYSIYQGKATVERQSTAITTSNIKEKISYKGNEYTVTTIGGSAFDGCTGLTSVTIPNSVTSIGEDAFSGCTKLTIYCKAKRKPLFGWKKNWNSSGCPVVWGHKKN